MRIYGYCVFPKHWHFLLWPVVDDDLSSFMQRLTDTHVQRWQLHRHHVGHGRVYQGRFKSFPVGGVWLRRAARATGPATDPVERAARLLGRSAGRRATCVQNTARVPLGALGSGEPPELRAPRRNP